MRNARMALPTAILAIGLVVGGASAAYADTRTEYPPEGGTWTYGTEKSGGNTWASLSRYHHPSAKHRASACQRATDRAPETCDRVVAEPGNWAKAYYGLGTTGRGTAYYYRF
jgi:hypothetical protein